MCVSAGVPASVRLELVVKSVFHYFVVIGVGIGGVVMCFPVLSGDGCCFSNTGSTCK